MLSEHISGENSLAAASRSSTVMITEPPVVEQVLRRNRDVTAPAGKRWFVVRSGTDVAGMGSMLVHGRAAYLERGAR